MIPLEILLISITCHVEIKEFNALIDNTSVFDQPVKNKQGAYKKRIEMSRNNDYTTLNLLNYLYHQNY